MERKMERSKEIEETLKGIHALWMKGKITLEQHNNLCYQACHGSTEFEL